MVDCCNHSKKDSQCQRKTDNKTFSLPRKFSKKQCSKPRGFSMKSSCAPYKDCINKRRTKQSRRKRKTKKKKTKRKQQFLYNPKDPNKSFDVYIDKDPTDTIPIRYKTLQNVKETIRKLERLYKNGSYPHKRIKQVSMIMMVRLRVIKDKKPKQYKLANLYHDFLGERTLVTNESDRKRMKFTMGNL